MRLIATFAAFVTVAATATLAAPIRVPVPSTNARDEFSSLTDTLRVRDAIETLNNIDKRAGGEEGGPAQAGPAEQGDAPPWETRQERRTRLTRESRARREKLLATDPSTVDEADRPQLIAAQEIAQASKDKEKKQGEAREETRKAKIKAAKETQKARAALPPAGGPAPPPSGPAPPPKTPSPPPGTPPRPPTPPEVSVARGTVKPWLVGPRR
ncbi:hypothetical protein EIP91_001814 [Steccherinum ochraceum]|uniref:Uncharacterized protein n=1 Tax=Steccherinum ochraceum TaxID=92696 RepID=A0A4R0RTP3_9APHY|nr:hypothetical protein EIP91_001814 [Steccherinum ochraceum]